MTEIQRFTQSKPCPVCGGSQDDLRGRGPRCGGVLSGGDKYAHCTNIEYANGLQLEGPSQSYRHDLFGACACGVEHGQLARRQIVATHDYRDATGELIYPAIRFEPKNFALRRPDGAGGWVWNMNGVTRLPYR